MESLTSEGLTRVQIRKLLRARRNAISDNDRRQASLQLYQHLQQVEAWQQATCVAAYLTNDGEVDLQPAINHAQTEGKTVSLPVIHPFNRQHLLFIHYHAGTTLVANRFNISEPALRCPDVVPFANHDVILMPLVGFDLAGNRLGMGGGFYDRVLAPYRNATQRPTLIGTAHDCQLVDTLPVAPWDFPLDMIITPSGLIRPTKV